MFHACEILNAGKVSINAEFPPRCKSKLRFSLKLRHDDKARGFGEKRKAGLSSGLRGDKV